MFEGFEEYVDDRRRRHWGIGRLAIPEHEAEHCEDHLQKGGILLADHCDNSEEIKQAKEILKCR